jgi:hypothetical protein
VVGSVPEMKIVEDGALEFSVVLVAVGGGAGSSVS